MSNPKAGPSRLAFTLVELLVVIGIIAVLIAMLMPAISRAREQSNRLKCASNLRSIGQALTMYTHHFGYYPGLGIGTATGGRAVWPVRLRPYLGGDQRVFYCPSQDPECQWETDAPGPVVFATDLEARYGYDLGERVILTMGMKFSYGYNGYGTLVSIAQPGGFYFNGLGGEVSTGTPRVNQVRVPSEMIAITDSTVDGWFDLEIKVTRDVHMSIPGAIHGGGANVLFCDGHVQRYSQADLIVDDDRSLVQAPRYRMWSIDHRTWSDNIPSKGP